MGVMGGETEFEGDTLSRTAKRARRLRRICNREGEREVLVGRTPRGPRRVGRDGLWRRDEKKLT
jgi:hypothetical protein